MTRMTLEEQGKKLEQLSKLEAYCRFVLAQGIIQKLSAVRDLYREVPINWPNLDEALAGMEALKGDYAGHTNPNQIHAIPGIAETIETVAHVLETCPPEYRVDVACEIEFFAKAQLLACRERIRGYDRGLAWRTIEAEYALFRLVDPYNIPGWSGFKKEFKEAAINALDSACKPMEDLFRERRKDIVNQL